MDSIRVETLAARSGISVAAIRYYQSRGLLPAPRREGRVAWYDESHVDRLKRIRDRAAEGFSLAQITRLLYRPEAGDDPLADSLDAARPRAEHDRDSLARATNLPRVVVDLVADQGLLGARDVDGRERFDEGAVRMLEAAAAVGHAGVPVDRLFALAERHHAHVGALVDEAVELFHRQVDHDRTGRAELATTLETLIPAVTRLVGDHFQRALLDRVTTELNRPDPVIVRTVELVDDGRTSLDGLDLFERAAGPDQWRVLWHHPERDVTLAALGAAVVLDATSGSDATSRFAHTAASLLDLRERVAIDAPAGAPAPTLIGGFAFADTPGRSADWRSADARWAPLGDGALILPEVCLLQRGGRTWLQLATSDHVDRLDVHHRHVLDLLRSRPSMARPGPSLVATSDPSVDPDYEALVNDGLDAISRGGVEKLVLARRVDLTGELDVAAALGSLRADNQRCVTFAFAFGSTCFFGATPELLVDVTAGLVSTTAVAGTRPRDADAEVDDALAAELIGSEKEQAEHRFVVAHLVQALAAAGVRVEPHAAAEVERFASVSHLVTRLSGRAELGPDGLIQLVGRLHPTPAVGGAPVTVAADWLAQHEGLDRGWYAGPIGVVDLDGNGEFWVALRSALSHDEGVTAYVGAGVVAGSVPARELDETTAKLTTVGRAIGLAAR